MGNYPVKCKSCGTVNIITKDGTVITKKDCDKKECKNCGKKGMEYPQMFDDPKK